jgi:ABC-type amino acid transport substrate-binding protein
VSSQTKFCLDSANLAISNIIDAINSLNSDFRGHLNIFNRLEKNLLKNFAVFLLFTSVCSAAEYHFVSINKLIEQEIGRLVIPQIYKKLGIDITITPLPAKRAQLEAISGKSDGEIMRIYNYGEENPTTIRVPTPYYSLETMAFIKKNAGIEITKKEDLAKYKIVKIRGVKHTNNITEGLVNVSDVDTTEQMMWLVEKGMVDVALTNTIDGLMALRTLNMDDIVPLDTPLATLDLFHYIHESHKDLVPLVDNTIKEMLASGELSIIIKTAEKKVITMSLGDLQ